jgi:hypothetical protein
MRETLGVLPFTDGTLRLKEVCLANDGILEPTHLDLQSVL